MVSEVKRHAQFLPTPAPRQTSEEMRAWLGTEFERIELVTNEMLDVIDQIRSAPRMFLAGDTDDFTLDVLAQKFVNYAQGGSIGEVPFGPDQVAGDITLPVGGAYGLTAYMIGDETSVAQNVTIELIIDVNGTKEVVATVDVATSQTSSRSMSISFSRVFAAGDVISMWLSATGNLGTFIVKSTTLEMSHITLIEDTPENLNLNF